MSAELRRAAKEMRERAMAADEGPWEVNDDGDLQTAYEPTEDYGPHVLAPTMHRPTARHIASWHPAVALAVADWLDRVATALENGDELSLGEPTDARAIASTYLGEDVAS